MTSPILPPLTPPQLAVLQKPANAAPTAESAEPSAARAAPTPSAPASGTGRGRLLDIVV